MKHTHLAIDIGASSGRLITGFLEDGKMHLQEVYRFENGLVKRNGHLCWNVDGLWHSILEGLKACREKDLIPETIGIDTWAVDYVLLDHDGKRIGDSVAYRDARTDGIREELERNHILSFSEMYERTGIQYQKFNTAYQLYAQKKEHPEEIEQAEVFLMIPDYLNYLLTGRIANEYTNASTTALINAQTKTWDDMLIGKLGLPRKIFQKIAVPGTVLGDLKPEIQKEAGFNAKVILPATHDTGSAFLAVPVEGENSVFLSSGTWSLIGTENKEPHTDSESMMANFTNEGGYQYRFRYLKNIMGLWMIQNVRKELQAETGKKISFPDLIAMAEKEKDFPSVVNVDHPRFLAPSSMMEEVKKACSEKKEPVPENAGQVLSVIYHSLADDYAVAVSTLQKLTGKTFENIHIVGGGCQDMYLNQLTANAAGRTVYAGPVEGTALGNLIVQWIASGELSDLNQARNTIRESFDIREVKPQ